MAKQVVIFDQQDRFSTLWSLQFQYEDRLNRAIVAMSPSHILGAVHSAADQAQNGGTIIFAVGHGGASKEFDCTGGLCPASRTPDLAEGMVDLAPNQALRLQKDIVFYDFDPDGDGPGKSQKNSDETVIQRAKLAETPPGRAIINAEFPGDPAGARDYMAGLRAQRPAAIQRQKLWQAYRDIGAAIRGRHVYKAVFLTCRVGKAIDFIRKIAFDWQVIIQAYKRRVAFQKESDTSEVRVFLYNDSLNTGTNTKESRTRVPQVEFYLAGPPGLGTIQSKAS